jgi:predicted nuclease with TOPRIM domain
MKEENKTMSSTVNELKSSLKDAKDKSDKLNEANRELKDRLVKVKEDYTKIKIDYDNLLVANELLSCNTHEAINHAVKICWGCASVRRRSHTKKQLRLKSFPRDGRRSLFMELRRFKPT